MDLLRRRILIAFAVTVAFGILARRAWADPFTFLQAGFSQSVYGSAPRPLDAVAFAPNGDVWAPGGTGGSFTRFDSQRTVVVHGTTVHPEVAGSPFSSVVTRGVANHPNGALYANTANGIVKLDADSAGLLNGPFGSAGNEEGIATDPVTGNLLYVRNDAGIQFADPDFTSTGIFSGDTFDETVHGIAFDPSGAFLFVAVQNPDVPPGSLVVLDRNGATVQTVSMASVPDGIALHSAPQAFVVTNNTDGTMTRLDFPGNDYSQPPVQSVFASGGFPGSLMQVGADTALYVTQAETRFDNGTITRDSSIARIGSGFVPPPGIGAPPMPQFVPPTPANGAVFNVTAGQPLAFTVKASERGAVPLTLSVNGLPPGATQTPPLPANGNPVSSDFSWTPGLSDAGSHAITYRATDDGGNFVDTTLTVIVQLPPPPQFVPPTPGNGSVLTVAAGQLLRFTVAASSAADTALTLSAAGAPAGATQIPGLPASGNPVSSVFSWTPGSGDVGSHVITYRATDSLGQFVETSVTVRVVPSQVLSVRLSLFNSAGKRVARVLLRRRAGGSFVGSFPKLKPDVYLAIAEGYASTDGTGPVVATARGTATVQAHHTVVLHLVWS